VRYVRGPETVGSDTVFATSYIEAHDTQGWFTDTKIRTPYGDGQDIWDRQKVRVEGRHTLLGEVKLNEEAHVRYRYIRHGGGPVRVLREYGVTITAVIVSFDASFATEYFPFSTVFGTQGVEIKVYPGLTVALIRLSSDLHDRVSTMGMKFFNAFNSNGITVDGAADSPVSTITDPPNGVNWLMLTGDPGTIVTLMNIPVLGEKRELYYKDNATLDNADTGDKKSYGDSGILVTSTSNISGRLSFDFTTYYVDKNQPGAAGEQFKLRKLKPVQVTAEEQTRTITSVSEDASQPTDFRLDDARPNPFAPLQGQVQISFNLGRTNIKPGLRIFNLLGQEVARFEAADLLRRQTVLWDGRDRYGRLAPAGIYFYELTAGRPRAVKKLILLR
jgi:hypothetical protein